MESLKENQSWQNTRHADSIFFSKQPLKERTFETNVRQTAAKPLAISEFVAKVRGYTDEGGLDLTTALKRAVDDC